MFTVKENKTLVDLSELNFGIENILEKTKEEIVIIEKKHKSQAVLMSNEEYEHFSSVLETAEDIVLGSIAADRYTESKESDYIDIEQLL